MDALDSELYQPGAYIMISRLFYLARMMIARYWMAPTIQTVKQWIDWANSLLREQLAYHHQKALCKFQIIWQVWLDTPSLASPQLIMDRLL